MLRVFHLDDYFHEDIPFEKLIPMVNSKASPWENPLGCTFELNGSMAFHPTPTLTQFFLVLDLELSLPPR